MTADKQSYQFGPFRVDALKRRLLLHDAVVPLTPKAFDILLVLIHSNGEIVGKEDLIRAVWPDTAVEENNLTRNISALRKALGENPAEHRYVVTIPGRGYRFVAEVTPTFEYSEVPATTATPSRKPFRRMPFDGRILVAALIVLVVSIRIGRWTHRADSTSRAGAFENFELSRLTYSGNAGSPAISPDGKYVAYNVVENGYPSIRLKHLAVGSTQQILPPSEVRHLGGLTFSRDGKQIYFIKSDKLGPLNSLYRMPALGGVPSKVITGVDGIGLSPDGKRLAFIRNSRELDESALMIANEDGTGEHQLARRPLSDGFSYAAWSPDGKVIVSSAGSTEVSGARMYPVEVRVADGAQRVITDKRWVLLEAVSWLADGSGLIVAGRDKGTVTNWIWRISYPGGEVRKLTADTDTYTGLSLSADTRALVSSKLDLQRSIWTANVGHDAGSRATSARQITSGTSNYLVFGWLPDGRILYTSSANNPLGEDIWIMNPDGSGIKQLTAGGRNESPTVSRDGRFIIFESDRANSLNLWRMENDGTNLRQLTQGKDERFPAISPDGKWVVYTSADDEILWKMPVDGGPAHRLTDKGWRASAISPDGKWIASFFQDPQQPQARFKIGLVPFEGGAPARLFDFPTELQPAQAVRWAPDGQSLIYPGKRGGFWNLWRQPIIGGKPASLTDFNSTDQIFSFDCSPDGKQIALARGSWVVDVVMMRDVRP